MSSIYSDTRWGWIQLCTGLRVEGQCKNFLGAPMLGPLLWLLLRTLFVLERYLLLYPLIFESVS
ncbi:hypothetical protein GGQ07_003226 [Salinibacter ruber]|nr:hypothetical protein [Salinibacter ruber]MCS4181766.1 hypothetical protein [Salinibacter ruber]